MKDRLAGYGILVCVSFFLDQVPSLPLLACDLCAVSEVPFVNHSSVLPDYELHLPFAIAILITLYPRRIFLVIVDDL